jgi:Secretion system C-terminal sorting domain
VNQEGTVLDTASITIDNDEGSVSDVAFGDTNYLVVWEEFGSIPHYYNIKGTRMNPQGIVLDPIITIALDNQCNPSVAFDGINYLVIWENGDIYGARISQAGIILDRIIICAAQNGQNNASISFGDTNYLVVWQDYRSGSSYDIYGAKVDQSGAIISSFPISTQRGDQSVPDLAHGLGDEFLITYSGWIDSINHHPANTMRIWGKFSSDIGIEEENSKVKTQSAKLFDVYPNPARLFLAIRLPQSADRQDLKIFDVSGKLVKVAEKVTSAQSHNQEVRISLKGISPGIYFLRLGKETKKFLVVK